MTSPTKDTIFSLIESERAIRLSTEGLLKGINNYHIDIRLSRKYSSDIKKLVALLISQVATPDPKTWDNSKQFKQLRSSYLDMMTVLIHRVKTDLTADHVSVLQLAAIKHILQVTRSQVDKEIEDTGVRLIELKNRGASKALATDQRLFWLKRNYDSILYNVNKPLIAQIYRTEKQKLHALRNQFLGAGYEFSFNLITNPMLWTGTLSNIVLQLNEYSLWDIGSEETGFLMVDTKIVDLIDRYLGPLKILPIKEQKTTSVNNEIHDELGGLFQLQNLVGPSPDTKDTIEEAFEWFELEENVKLLFDERKSSEWLSAKRKELGFFQWLAARKEIKNLNRLVNKLAKQLKKERILPQLVTSSILRKFMSPLMLQHLETKNVCQFLTGKMTMLKLQETFSGNSKLSPEQVKLLEQYKESVAEQVSKNANQAVLKLLLDVSRFRRDLKLFRFAHRVFNRISIITDEDDLKLSKSAGTLYQLPMQTEVEDADAKICHHTILKADVRGSTTVTDELLKKGLNPASYFSMRFFNPINKILETYGANKVFIEGDAIILSFLEYENTPEQWFSVARACGYAKDMLIITGANNRYSTQMGLPLLELGVGICYSEESPRFLYDEDHPIMISRAIGLADRMSGCSWNLRAAIKKNLFNVDVLEIAEGESDKGEKGQHYARYNVNGINLDDLAFAKLKSEIPLVKLKMKLNGEEYIFHVGKYPDARGQKKDLIIREGQIGAWANNEIQSGRNSEKAFFEVVVNRKVIPVILNAVKSETNNSSV